MPSPEYWYNVGKTEQSKFAGSGMQAVWVLGYVWDDGTCYLNFPSTKQYSNVAFASTDANEKYLTYFDAHGISVYLQVEPGKANVSDLIKIVMDRYGHHPCVVGFGVDTEWYKTPAYQDGKPITDQEAAAWYGVVSSYNPDYQLFLKHWLASHMPPTYRKGIYFIDDSMGFSSLTAMTNEFAAWGKAFPNNPVGFQFGYPDDKSWWKNYSDPFSTIGHSLVNNIPNAKGIYWVDFSVKDLYPV